MTIIDGLTQVHVKRYLLEALDKELMRARRHMRDLSFLMLDIDHFKKINDVHGHLAGDYVLKEVARIIQQRIRRDEVLARYGGEEFAIILPETTLEGAHALAEGLREKIEESRFVFQSETIRVTISIGGAMLQDSDRTSLDLIKRADEKLYEAKRAGRNRVSCDVERALPGRFASRRRGRGRARSRRGSRRSSRRRWTRGERPGRRRAGRTRRRSSTSGARGRTSSTSTATATSISPRASARCSSGTCRRAWRRPSAAQERRAVARARGRLRRGGEGRPVRAPRRRSTRSPGRA